MRRFYYISDDLDNLEQIEHELESGGIARPQIYLLSNDDVGLENHDVNRVASFLKTDVVHLGEIGAVFGLAIAALILLVAHYSGIAAEVSWVPFIFLAIMPQHAPAPLNELPWVLRRCQYHRVRNTWNVYTLVQTPY